MARYLAHAVMHSGRVFRQSVVELDGGVVTVTRFDGEIHSTIFVSGIVAVVPEERVISVNIDRMKRIMERATLVEDAIKRVAHYLEDRNLAVAPGETPRLVILQR